MKLEESNLIRKGEMMGKKSRKNYKTGLKTFTKKAVTAILIISLIDLQLSYILAFIGKEQIAESLSSTIADTVIGVMIGYFFKALFETFFEKRFGNGRDNKNPNVVDV